MPLSKKIIIIINRQSKNQPKLPNPSHELTTTYIKIPKHEKERGVTVVENMFTIELCGSLPLHLSVT